MSTTTPHPAPALPVRTGQDITHALDTTGASKVLRTAIKRSAPALRLQRRDTGTDAPVAWQGFTEAVPHAGQTRTSGTIVFTADGTATIRAHAVPRHRWITALSHLGFDPGLLDIVMHAEPAQDGASGTPDKTGRRRTGITLAQPGPVRTRTFFERPGNDAPDLNAAMLILTPHDPQAYGITWQRAAAFFHVLATGQPPRT